MKCFTQIQKQTKNDRFRRFFQGSMILLLSCFALFFTQCGPSGKTGAGGEGSNTGDTLEIGCMTCGADHFSMNPFPTSDNYPISEDTLESWMTKREGHKMRKHGWELFSGLMGMAKSKTGDDVWLYRTWPTATQAFAPDSLQLTLNQQAHQMGTAAQRMGFLDANEKLGMSEQANITPPGYRVPGFVCEELGLDSSAAYGCKVPANGCELQNNGDVLIGGVIYNEPAYKHIRDNALYDFSNLANKWITNHTEPDWAKREIPEFPEESFVLKPMLWPVKQTGYTPLPIFPLNCYDGSSGCDTIGGKVVYSGFEEKRVWNTGVAITTAAVEKGTTIPSIDFLYDVYTDASYGTKIPKITYDNPEVHNIDEFYGYQIDSATWVNMDCVDRALINQAAYWAYGEPFQAGDYVVMVAMHIITKEKPSWTFQSIWWDNTAAGSKSNKYNDMRSSVSSPNNPTAFNSYLMATTYGMNKKPNQGNPKEWPVAYNPFIELAAAHPIETNCINCHQRGAFPKTTAQRKALKAMMMEHYASYALDGDGFPSMLDTFNFDNEVMDSLLIMDYQWAISDRVAPE